MPTTFRQVKNNAKTQALNNELNNTASPVTINVLSTASFPTVTNGFWVTIYDKANFPDPGDDPNMEIVFVNAITPTTMTLVRNQQNTTAKVHGGTPAIELMITEQLLIDIQTAVNAAEASIASNVTAIANNTTAIAAKANDAAVLHLTGSERVTGPKTFDPGAFLDNGNQVYNVKGMGFLAKGDGKYTEDGGITTGTPTLTSATAAFTNADVGKQISVKGASNTGTNTLNTTILSVTNSTTVVLATNATLTVANAEVTWGTDDYAAIQAAINAAGTAGGGIVYLPQGIYLISQGLLVTGQNVGIRGAGWSLPHPGETNGVMLGTSLTSIRPMASFAANTYALTFNNVNYMIIGNSLADIAFDGRAIKTAANVGALHYGNAAFTVSERFVVTDFSGHNILIDMANNIYPIPSVSQMWFDNFTIMNGGYHGIVFGDGNFASDFYISRAWIWGFGSGHGIHLGNSGGQQATLISDATIGACSIGLWIGSFEVIAHDLFIQASHSHGIYVYNPHNNGYYQRLHDNIIRDSDSNLDGSSDIYIASGSYNTILSANICEKVGANCGENGITVVDGFGVNGNYVESSNFSVGHTVANYKNGSNAAWNGVRYPSTVDQLNINNGLGSNITTLNVTQNDTTNNPPAITVMQYANNTALNLTGFGTTGGGNVTTGLRITAPNQTSGNMVQIYNGGNQYLAGNYRGMVAIENGAATSTIDALTVIQAGTGSAISVWNGYGAKSFTIDKTGAVLAKSATANALTIGPNGTTNPVLNVDASAASVATGLNIAGAAAAAGLALAVLSSGANENLTVNAKGTGTITLGAVSTGGIVVGSNTATNGLTLNVADTQTWLTLKNAGGTHQTWSTSGSTDTINYNGQRVYFYNMLSTAIGTGQSNALCVGANGLTNPVLQVDAGQASQATGITIQGKAAGSGVTITAISSGTNENLTISGKGTGAVLLGSVFKLLQATTAAAPAYVLGGAYFDTTLNKLRIGGVTAWETVTSS